MLMLIGTGLSGSPARTILYRDARPRASASGYLFSLGTNTVLGNVTNGLLVLSLDGGAEN
jgi:hypothetical protein